MLSDETKDNILSNIKVIKPNEKLERSKQKLVIPQISTPFLFIFLSSRVARFTHIKCGEEDGLEFKSKFMYINVFRAIKCAVLTELSTTYLTFFTKHI